MHVSRNYLKYSTIVTYVSEKSAVQRIVQSVMETCEESRAYVKEVYACYFLQGSLVQKKEQKIVFTVPISKLGAVVKLVRENHPNENPAICTMPEDSGENGFEKQESQAQSA